ncbi:MAG: NAD(P)-binding domain-containing protein [Blastocatellia bacterium]|nr:NAD(P)-binding domain-containing protein [Blastocatellia bacterium]MBN8725272.1 NAD(P)-binding domain-containing protein [Acidobacteriota bacterium]
MTILYDLIIIGAGPAGIAAAYTAQKLQLNYLVLEKSQIANTIYNYPLGKELFSTANELEFDPNTLHYSGTKPTREELLNYYNNFVYKVHNLNIYTDEPVIQIISGKIMSVISTKDHYKALNVLVAVGTMGIVNRLNVKGETPERVSYFFREAASFKEKEVVVIGGGNSAAETMLDLCQAGAKATMVLRRSSLDRIGQGTGIKPWVQMPLEQAWKTGKLSIVFNAQIKEILPTSIKLIVKDEIKEIACEQIFALTGTKPDVQLLERAGAKIAEDGKPIYDIKTYETTIPNLFVIGHLTREMHMKNAIALPPQIVRYIAKLLAKIG